MTVTEESPYVSRTTRDGPAGSRTVTAPLESEKTVVGVAYFEFRAAVRTATVTGAPAIGARAASRRVAVTTAARL